MNQAKMISRFFVLSLGLTLLSGIAAQSSFADDCTDAKLAAWGQVAKNTALTVPALLFDALETTLPGASWRNMGILIDDQKKANGREARACAKKPAAPAVTTETTPSTTGSVKVLPDGSLFITVPEITIVAGSAKDN